MVVDEVYITLSYNIYRLYTNFLMSSLPIASDDYDEVANVSIGRVRQAYPESQSRQRVVPSGVFSPDC